MGPIPVRFGAVLLLIGVMGRGASGVSDDYLALMRAGHRAIDAGAAQEALTSFQQAYEEMQAADLPAEKLFPVQIAISTAYLQTGNISQAERALLKADELERKAPSLRAKAELVNNWACVHVRLGHYKQAIEESEKILLLIEKEPTAAELVPHLLDGMAASEIHLGQYEQALRHQQESVQRFRTLFPVDHPDVIKGYSVLGTAQFMCGQIAESRVSFEIAIHSAERIYGEQSPQLASLIRDELIVLNRLGLKKEMKARQRELSRIPPVNDREISSYTRAASVVP